jgi:hypothetical protein
MKASVRSGAYLVDQRCARFTKRRESMRAKKDDNSNDKNKHARRS